MNTKLKLVGIATAFAFALPFVASAATISDPLFSNSDTTIDVAGNSTVSGTFTLQIGSGEVCEVLRTQAAPQAFTDTSVGGSLGYQFGTYTNVPFSVKVSPNTGTYNATVQCAGQFGGNRAVDGNDGIVVGPQGLGTIRVVASGSTSAGGTNPTLDALIAQIATLTGQISCMSTGGTWSGTACVPKVVPPASTKCSTIAPFLSAPSETYSALGVQLQSALLLDNPYAIPALKPGSSVPMGWRGVQTNSAVSAYLSAYHCQ